MTDPERRAAIANLPGTPDPLAELRRQVHELLCRVEDLAGVVADLQHLTGRRRTP